MENKKHDTENEALSVESILNEDFESEESFSLESILAEYKSDAFMAGDKRTPSDVLQQRTDSILREVRGESAPAERTGGSVEQRSAGSGRSTSAKRQEVSARPGRQPADAALPGEQTAVRRAAQQPRAAEERRGRFQIDDENVSDSERRYFENFRYADADAANALKAGRGDARGDDDEDDGDLEDGTGEGVLGRLFQKRSGGGSRESVGDGPRGTGRSMKAPYSGDGDGVRYARRDFDEEDMRTPADESRLEPFDDYSGDEEPLDIPREINRFAVRVPSARLRAMAVGVICALMLLITFMSYRGSPLPFGIGDNARTATGVMLIMELLVIALGLDVLVSGFDDVLRLSFSAESLILFSCIASVTDGFVMLIRNDFTNGLSLALVSASSLYFALIARKCYYMAMCDSLKTSMASASPYGLIAESESIEGRQVLKKVPGAVKGFYNRLTEADFGETQYKSFAPLFLALSLILSLLTSLTGGRAADFFRTFSIMTAVSAPFTGCSLYAVPFRYAAARAKKVGSAVAGWGGASDIYYSDGAVISDQDLYPTGTVSLGGIKLFEKVSQRKAIVYTSSLVIASGSGLVKVFEELLKSQEYMSMQVKEFAYYDGGGIGGVVAGERVLVGNGGFMNLMGIRVPDGLNDKSNLFTAINGELAAFFTINYVPTNSVQAALVSLLRTRTRILMAIRDVNITPNSIQQKFKVSTDGLEYVPVETVYKLSENSVPEGCGSAAILCRGGLAPVAEVITRGRRLKMVCEFNTLISLVGSAVGLLMMFFICWTGSFASASAMNIFTFLAVLKLAVWGVSQLVRTK